MAMAFDPNRWTLRTQEAVQAAVEMARTQSHPEVTPDHLLAALLGQEEGVVLPVLAKVGLAPLTRAQPGRRSAGPPAQGPRRSGAAAQPGAAGHVMEAADGARAELHDEYLSTEHLLLALADRIGVDRDQLLCALREVRGSHRVTSQNPEDQYQALERYGRDLTDAARAGQARPGHRARRGDPPGHPGAVPADEEQPGPHRRARRGQDRHRRGPGPAHRRGRRPRGPQEQAAHRPRPVGHGGGGQVPGRVRGTAQGRPQGDRRLRRADHHLHRRDAHRRRAPARPRAPWTPATCSSPCWPGASCA